jgi:predicted TIM-barrel fold metal-dependent hydrolase
MTAAPYEDVRPFADALIEANPGQLVSGTDWPHPSIPIPMPDGADLLDMFGSWVDDPELRQQCFVKNPERLYGFEAWQ